MKMMKIAAAAMLTLTGLAPAALVAPASAQRVVVHERTTVVRNAPRRDRWRTRRVCSNQWRNHHRVRVCRTVRYRY